MEILRAGQSSLLIAEGRKQAHAQSFALLSQDAFGKAFGVPIERGQTGERLTARQGLSHLVE